MTIKNPTRMRSIQEQCNKCKHFGGIGNDAKGEHLERSLAEIEGKPWGRGTCRAGVNYNEVMKTGARMIALPCFPMEQEPDNMPADGIWPTCPKREWKTDAELDAEAADHENRTRKMMAQFSVIRPAIVAAAKAKGGGKGKKDVVGLIDCPSCKTGKVGYSMASINGHVWAKCSTDGCAEWME